MEHTNDFETIDDRKAESEPISNQLGGGSIKKSMKDGKKERGKERKKQTKAKQSKANEDERESDDEKEKKDEKKTGKRRPVGTCSRATFQVISCHFSMSASYRTG